VFDLVEIDSTFYRLPTPSTIRQWKDSTPTSFLFSAKLSKKITHDSRLKDISRNLKSFETIVKGLGNKLACVIAQMPPNFKFEKNFDLLNGFLNETDPSIRYAVEFRDSSWYREETYDLLKKKNTCLAWSVTNSTERIRHSIVTSDFIYIRFMGHFGEFPKFDHVQKEKQVVLAEWLRSLRKATDSVKEVFVLMSNHFEGFAPSTVNSFRTLMGLKEANWKEKMEQTKENPKLI
jgi:uncharacterized protein YecE (DUF72 family)